MTIQCRDDTLPDRFWKKVQKAGEDECWNWTGATQAFGYGCIGAKGRIKSAHRVSYEMAKGPIPDGICVLHKCDNPKCVNPKHLFAGTKKDNAIDRSSKGRGKHCVFRGEDHPSAKITASDVLEIRASTDKNVWLARKYGVSDAQICRIKRGERWGRV